MINSNTWKLQSYALSAKQLMKIQQNVNKVGYTITLARGIYKKR